MTTPAGDDPRAYLAEDRRRALARGEVLPERVRGAALFADISGFTALTEALADELGPQRGAEELTGVLDVVFAGLMRALHLHGGSVLYFSGDAVTCWLDGDTGLRAASAGLAMQEVMDRVGLVATPGGVQVSLRLKVAVAVGPARRFVVGDPAVQLVDVLAGRLMDEVAAAEGTAEPGQVVLTEAALAGAGGGAVATRGGSTPLGPVWILTGLDAPAAPSQDADLALPDLDEDVVRQWLLPPVYERMRSGGGRFLAELRPVVPVFLRFTGIDFDDDEDAPAVLDAFVTAAQRVLDQYGGNLLQLTVGDKGAYLYGTFGAPLAHADDAARACAAALELLGLVGPGPVRDLQVGIASGRLRSGTYGHPDRRTYSCLGDATNLAARLMGRAEPGTVLVSDAVRRAAGPGFGFGPVVELALKGKAGVQPAARLEAVRAASADAGSPLRGRASELATLTGLLGADDGAGRVAVVLGEPGMGRTRLVADLVARAEEAGAPVVAGAAALYGGAESYAAWRGVWRGLFGLAPGRPAPTDLAAVVAATPVELRPRLPLLAPLLGLAIPETPLTSGLDAKLRKASLADLAVRLLPLLAGPGRLVVVEDVHALDELARDLLLDLVRDLPPLTLVLTALPPEPGSWLAGLLAQEGVTTVALGPLPEQACRELVEEQLSELGGPGLLHRAAAVAERAQGNPLWVRELCRFVHEQESTGASSAGEELPSSLQGLVLGRVDALPDLPRRTAKVASVFGQDFAAPALGEVEPDLGPPGAVLSSLRELAAVGVARLEDAAVARWQFCNAVLRDVAYETLPFAVRRLLHGRVAAALEVEAADEPDRWLDQLAHHHWFSDHTDRTRHYLELAAAAQESAYAHEASVVSLERLLTLVGPAERGGVLLRRGKVRELGGDWAGAQQDYADALDLAGSLGDAVGEGWARSGLAELLRRRGQYEEAAAELALARGLFAAGEDAKGTGQVLHLLGTLAAQQGHFDEARGHYDASLEVRRGLGDSRSMANLLSNLAVVAEYQSDYARAVALGEEALALRRETGDRWGLGVSEINLGMIAVLQGDAATARRRFETAIGLMEEVGDAWSAAVAHHNLGNALRDLGDHTAAAGLFARTLLAYRRYDDDWVRASLFEDVAALAGDTGREPDALVLVGVADAIRGRLGSPRPEEVQQRLAASAEALAPTDRGPLLARGAGLDRDASDALLLELCGAAD